MDPRAVRSSWPSSLTFGMISVHFVASNFMLTSVGLIRALSAAMYITNDFPITGHTEKIIPIMIK